MNLIEAISAGKKITINTPVNLSNQSETVTIYGFLADYHYNGLSSIENSRIFKHLSYATNLTIVKDRFVYNINEEIFRKPIFKSVQKAQFEDYDLTSLVIFKLIRMYNIGTNYINYDYITQPGDLYFTGDSRLTAIGNIFLVIIKLSSNNISVVSPFNLIIKSI